MYVSLFASSLCEAHVVEGASTAVGYGVIRATGVGMDISIHADDPKRAREIARVLIQAAEETEALSALRAV